MSNLEIFLIEEGYCNTEKEAIKILECISDEFYNFLVEEYDPGRFSPERVSAMTAKISRLKRQAQDNPQSITDPVKFRQRITNIQNALPKNQIMRELELKRRIKEKEAKPGILPTPRGKDGRKVQIPPEKITSRGGVSNPDIDNPTSANLDVAATELLKQHGLNLRPGSRGTKSVDSNRPDTSTITSNQFNAPGSSGGRGTNQARSGGIRGIRRQ